MTTVDFQFIKHVYKIMNQLFNTLELIRLEAILTHLNKPNICKKIEFDYTSALVT